MRQNEPSKVQAPVTTETFCFLLTPRLKLVPFKVYLPNLNILPLKL